MTLDRLQPTAALDAVPAAGARRVVAVGQVYFWQGGSLWIGRGQGRGDWHSHHALQIALALDGTCRFRSRADDTWREFRGAIVRSHRHHQFEVDGATVAQVFVEPETTEGRALLGHFAGDVCALPDGQRDAMAQLLDAAWQRCASAAEMIAAARAAVGLLAGAIATGDGIDARVTRAIDHIRARVQAGVALADAAAAAALSPSRFRHLFVQETGISFRAYVLWLRLNVAVEHAMAGGSWTDAAHEAGFADSAHLNRTFRRMLGLSPTALAVQQRPHPAPS
jgi:AraC-like DNA-binding protein